MLRICTAILLITVSAAIALGIWGGFTFTRHLIVAVDGFGEAGRQGTLTLNRLNSEFGTISEADKALVLLKRLIGHADIAAVHEEKNLTTLDAQERTLFNDLHATVLDTRTTITALAGTADQATADLKTANTSVAAMKPLLDGFTVAVGHADALVTSPHIQVLLDKSAVTMTHVAAVSATTDSVTAKAAAGYLHPAPKHWYNWVPPTIELGWKVVTGWASYVATK